MNSASGLIRLRWQKRSVWQALEAAMLGNNESARVSASRVLMDALAEPEEHKTEQRKRDRQRATAEAKARLSALLQAGASIEDAAATLDREAIDDHPDLVLADVSEEDCRRILKKLHENGVIIVPGLPKPKPKLVKTLREDVMRENANGA